MGSLLIMSKAELNRIEIIQKILEKRLTQVAACDYLHLSSRQIRRLIRMYEKDGVEGLLSKKRGKPSNNKLSQAKKDYALSLIKQNYADFGPTLAAEKLWEAHELKLSVESVRSLMIKADLWVPRNKRLKRSYQPRNRRERFGELIQIDGSLHPWFEDRGPKCTLLVYVDDATSKITSLYFAPAESTHSYFLATQQHLLRFGRPLTFYSDKFGVFKVNKKTAQDKVMTQFGRALYEMNIDLICANTCQAKGRVERANKTLQDRLVKELRLHNISSIEKANGYAPKFIKDYNKRFGKPPPLEGDAHRSLQECDDLYDVLCFKQERTVSNDLTIQYDRVKYLIEDTVENRQLRRQKIMLYEYPDGAISLNAGSRKLIFRKLYDRVSSTIQGRVVENKRLADVLEYIKKEQGKRTISRSTRCPRRRHLEVSLPQKTVA